MSKKERIHRIKKMLLEMASGNFFYRLERSLKNDAVEAIAVSLNMLSEEVAEAMLHQGYVNSKHTILETIQMSFIVDDQGCVKMVNQEACNILSVLQTDIIEKQFISFLDDKSRLAWTKTWSAMKKIQLQDSSMKLTFKTKGGLLIPKIAYITLFKTNDKGHTDTLINVIHHSYNRDTLENDLKRSVIQFTEKKKQEHDEALKPKIRLSFEDIRKLRKGRDIIMNNLDKDFPSLRDFALQLGTNEFKLKYGFKELYGITVHRFLMEERLRKSRMMVQFTDQALKSIAHLNGFKSISHFSRTFKKRYGYAPSDLRKKSFTEE